MYRSHHTVLRQPDKESRSAANTASSKAISLPAVPVSLHKQDKAGCISCGSNHNTLQRMVAVAANDLGQTKDALILNNLNYAHGHFGGVIGDFNSNRKFDQTKPGERVGLVAHGAPGHIGGFKAPQIAEILTAKDHPVNKEVSSIVLYSCNAGMDQATGVDTSLTHELSAELLKRNYEIGVEGQKGIGFGFKGIGERTTKGDEATGDYNWFSTRNKFFKKSEYKGWGDKVNGFVEADELLKVGGKLESGQISKMTLEEKAQKISEIMAPFWREIEKEMGDKLYDHLKGWVRVKNYVKGGQLVQDSR